MKIKDITSNWIHPRVHLNVRFLSDWSEAFVSGELERRESLDAEESKNLSNVFNVFPRFVASFEAWKVWKPEN